MYILDITVLVYAVGGDDPLADPARRLMAAIAAGQISATTTVEVVQEFAHVRSRRRSRTDAASLARHYLTLLGPLVSTSLDDVDRGLEMWTAHEALGAFNSVLLAASVRVGAQALISADQALAGVAGAPVVNLAEIDSILG